MTVSVRVATPGDASALEALIDIATRTLLPAFLSPEEIEASLELMTVDRLLIEDGTYFIAELGGAPVASGGWGRRREYVTALGDAPRGQELLDPSREPARVRAMYTHPDYARRGLGRLILRTCEDAARKAGFADAELLATLGGEPLYLAEGWHEIERTFVGTSRGIDVPAVRMRKALLSLQPANDPR